jgi:DNA primase
LGYISSQAKEGPLEIFTEAAQAKLALTASEFCRQLWDKSPEVLDHVRSRGLTDEQIVAAEIGYCNPYRTYWYGMRGRWTVPVKDIHGRYLGFAGRRFDPMAEMTLRAIRKASEHLDATQTQERIRVWESAKWLNEPFSKKRHLYGFHLAKPSMKRLGYGFLVEGYMDRLVLAARGIPNCVGVCGVAVSQIHAQLFKRYADKAVFLLDADDAGAAGTREGRKVFEAAGVRTLAIQLPKDETHPKGYDPDEYVLTFRARQLLEIAEECFANGIGNYEILI